MQKNTINIVVIILAMILVFTTGCKKNVENIEIPEGAIKGRFSVANGKQVLFSKGILQYIGSASTPYWKFADEQWEGWKYYDNQDNPNQNVDRDRFAWGTSGYCHGAVCYQPWSNSNNIMDYYAYGCETCGLWEYSGQADWGFNPIVNGGNTTNLWRTLKVEEVQYMLMYRETLSSYNWVLGFIEGGWYGGMILFPDDYLLDTAEFNRFYDNNTMSYHFTANEWKRWEEDGCVYLPGNMIGWTSNPPSNWVIGGFVINEPRYSKQVVRLVCPAD